ncbi:hypothetical protein Tco_0320556 [Tanacetum coccineum]
MLEQIDIPGILHLLGRLFESRGCLLLTCRDDIDSREFTIYEMVKGYSVWMVRYLVNNDEFMTPLRERWSIQSTMWSIGLGEREDDSFLAINIYGKVVKYNIISKTISQIFDIGSNQMDDDYELFSLYTVAHNFYEFILRRKIPNLDPPAGIFANHLRSLFECDFVSLDSRLNSKKSTMDHSFSSAEEVDHVRILQSCNGLLLCTVVQAGRTSGETQIQIYSSETRDWSLCRDWFSYFSFDHFESAIYWNDAFHWLEGLNRQLKHCKLNIEDHDHPIMTSLEIPHGLHRGRNFLESFDGPSNDPVLLLLEITYMLHLEGKFFESCGCLLLCRDDIGSTKFTIYEMMKGSSMWSVRYLFNTEQLMNPLPEGWSIRTSVWSICFRDGEEDAFVMINLSGKVVKYNLISKTNTEIFDIGSNQTDDDDDANDDDANDDDAVLFIPPFEVDLNLYEFIPSLASV